MEFDPDLSNQIALEKILHLGSEEGRAQIRELFPHAIYTKHLEPDPEVFGAMWEFMQRFDEHSAKIHGKRLQDSVTPPDSQEGDVGAAREESDGKPRKVFTSTGDVTGYGRVSDSPEFRWLNSEVEKCVLDYAARIDLDTRLISFFHQKSWPVVARHKAGVSPHSHPNASLSAVYYLTGVEPNQGGNLIFANPNTLPLSGHIVEEKIYKTNGSISYGVRPKKNLLVVFPSYLYHRVSPYRGEGQRYSVSYDIFMTASKAVDPGWSENIVPDPSYWTRFEDPSSDSS